MIYRNIQAMYLIVVYGPSCDFEFRRQFRMTAPSCGTKVQNQGTYIQEVLSLHLLAQYCFAIVPFSNRSKILAQYHFILYIPRIVPFINGTIECVSHSTVSHYTLFLRNIKGYYERNPCIPSLCEFSSAYFFFGSGLYYCHANPSVYSG